MARAIEIKQYRRNLILMAILYLFVGYLFGINGIFEEKSNQWTTEKIMLLCFPGNFIET